MPVSSSDTHQSRRDLWEAIEAGEYPEWELGVQIFDEKQADAFSFDVLDATKLIPEELVPVTPVGRLVLNRNPDNFFAETEQAAFCTAHVIPGIDFTNDPLLAGRIHSYVDTQISLLGGPNFHELPINAPIIPVHNNQRDGMHRQSIHRGRVAYEPNSLAGGCPFQTGADGYLPFPEPVSEVELRGKPEKFAEHYHQATLFYESQAPFEQQHIIDAFTFELSKLTVPGIRQRTIAMLRNVSESLASAVADNLGMTPMPDPLPRPKRNSKPELTHSEALSLTARPGNGGIRTRKVALMVAPGVKRATLDTVAKALMAAGAVVRLVGPRIGLMTSEEKDRIDADASFSNSPAPLFDALVVPDGKASIDALCNNGQALEFVRDQFRHGKAILAVGEGQRLLEQAGIPLDREDTGLVLADQAGRNPVKRFIKALEAHRHPERETDPPLV